VALGESGEFFWGNVTDISFVNDPGRDMPRVDQVAQPLGGEGVNFIVKCGHASSTGPNSIGISMDQSFL
jgi:hypothetical protein